MQDHNRKYLSGFLWQSFKTVTDDDYNGVDKMSVAGVYEITVNTPMGAQKTTLTVNVDGDTWTGSNAGDRGTMEITDGKVDGNTITWTSNVTVPMPMTLEGTATIDGDSISGSVKAGAFGAFQLSGSRAA
jgi:hypothetical protein